jgi:hypothetical protein
VRKKRDGEPLTFGDVLEADWLYDLFLREQAEALIAELDGSNNIARYLPEKKIRERAAGKDFAVGFATAEGVYGDVASGTEAQGPVAAFGAHRRAIVLTDECETSRVVTEGGRLLLAVVVPWPTNPEELKHIDEGRVAWHRLPLKPAPGEGEWPGGIVDFSKHVAVWHEAIHHGTVRWTAARNDAEEAVDADRKDDDHEKDEDERLLKIAWATYATRHGPVAGGDGFRKLIEACKARLDSKVWETERNKIVLDGPYLAADEAIARALARIWDLEGRTVDEIATVFERNGAGLDEIAPLVLKQLVLLRDDVEAAEGALRSAIEATGVGSAWAAAGEEQAS